MRSLSAPSYADRHRKALVRELAAMERARTRSPSRASSKSSVNWARSPSRSRSKSVPRVKQPQWMEATNVRLTATAEVAEAAAETGGQDLKALYVMKPKEVNKAASSQPQTNLADTEGARKALSSQPAQSHRDAAAAIHRLTGGGPKLPSRRAHREQLQPSQARHDDQWSTRRGSQSAQSRVGAFSHAPCWNPRGVFFWSCSAGSCTHCFGHIGYGSFSRNSNCFASFVKSY